VGGLVSAGDKGVRTALDRAAERERLAPARGCLFGLLATVAIEAVIVLVIVLVWVG
jgi:hypothetical protein